MHDALFTGQDKLTRDDPIANAQRLKMEGRLDHAFRRKTGLFGWTPEANSLFRKFYWPESPL
jgi:hypothetical protein